MAIGTNILRERLSSGDVLLGAALPFFSPEFVEWCGLVGFDWVFLDGEHLPLGVETCYSMVRAADACDLATLARLPRNESATVLSYSESGVDALMVPHVLEVADAEQFVASLTYPPKGNRGALSTSRAASYGLTQPPEEYFGDTSRHAIAVPLLEDIDAMPIASQVAEVEGVAAVFIGPGDLAMSMGLPGQANHPEVRNVIDKAVSDVSARGVPLGTAVGSAEAAIDAVQRGFRMVVVSVGSLMGGAVRTFLNDVRSA